MSESADTLHALESAARYSLGFVAKGAHPGRGAQLQLDRLASQLIRESGGMPASHYGRYGKGDRFAGRTPFAPRPYRTMVIRSSGSGGWRGTGARVHGAPPSTEI